ncbi:MAG: tetratricopeptide repeat protein, partial [Rhodospirillaceae bacterium]|nr:tetratricopeptide repeat protein [Rhodospirillaceae bacterium]
ASGQAITPITGYSANPSGQKGVLGTMGKKKMDGFMGQDGDDTGVGQDGVSTDVAIAPAQPIKPTLMYLPEGSVDEQYKHSFNLLRRAKYPEAAWKEFISVHKDEKLTENARYWLGETYYVQKRFLDSAQAFLQSYKSAPTGTKAADSLLKLGKSMSNMDKKDEACAAYAKLRKEFSAISPNVSKALKRETKALGCK